MDRGGAVAAPPADEVDCACAPPASAAPWLRIGLGLVISGQLMALSLARNLSAVEAAGEGRVAAALLGLTALAAALLLPDLLTALRRGWERGDPWLEGMFVLALAGGLGASLWGLATGGDVFFEVVTVVLSVHAVGAQLKQRSRTAAVDRLLASWLPARAARLEGDALVEVAVDALQVGDRVALFAGDTSPADGRVAEGEGWFDTRALDGQLHPVHVGAGGAVPGGARLVRGAARLALVARPAEGAHAQAARAMLEAAWRAPPSTGLARQAARWFAPAVGTVALLAGLGWTWGADASVGFRVATAVLLVACPCGLGVATPMALWAAASELERQGVRVRRLGALEPLAAARAVALDKTGTLTAVGARPQWTAEPGVDPAQVEAARGLAAAVQAWSDHPVAAALRGAPAPGLVAELRPVAGGGVAAKVGEVEVQITPTPEGPRGARVAVDGRPVARVTLGEHLVDGAAVLVDGLRARGLQAEVLTGDRAPAQVDAPSRVAMAPADKAERLRQLRGAGGVVFVGDAANDLPALAEADVAVTVAGARGVVADTADLWVDGPVGLLHAVDGARAVARRLRWLVGGSLTANALGVGIAACGLLHPVVAALIMAGTSAGVTLAAAPGSAR